jgi:hypothetical protein
MGNAKSKEIEVTTKFYGENSTDNPNQTFGQEQLPKCHKCHIKKLLFNQTNKYDRNSHLHYAIWSCKKN